jgi:anti-anti-sigma regulatory factor
MALLLVQQSERVSVLLYREMYVMNEAISVSPYMIEPGPNIPLDTHLCNLLTDLVLVCDKEGNIVYANPATQRWRDTPLDGHHFTDLVLFDDVHKGQSFFDAATRAMPDKPTPLWELVIGTEMDYTVATLRGYTMDEWVILVGTTEAENVSEMQQEMLELTSELSEAQREVRRQNRALQQALFDQRDLVRTIMRLTAPLVPIWDASILLSLVDGIKADQFEEAMVQIWSRIGEKDAHYVILDMSNITTFQERFINALVDISRVLQSLGVEPLLADAGSGARRAFLKSGVDTRGLNLYDDVHQAVAYVGAKTAVEQSHE